jgi:hypothetical protein
VIAYMYFGLGWIMATSFAGWFPEAATGRSAFGLIVFFAAWAWILWLVVSHAAARRGRLMVRRFRRGDPA